jgi:RHS repeat-associated protein
MRRFLLPILSFALSLAAVPAARAQCASCGDFQLVMRVIDIQGGGALVVMSGGEVVISNAVSAGAVLRMPIMHQSSYWASMTYSTGSNYVTFALTLLDHGGSIVDWDSTWIEVSGKKKKEMTVPDSGGTEFRTAGCGASGGGACGFANLSVGQSGTEGVRVQAGLGGAAGCLSVSGVDAGELILADARFLVPAEAVDLDLVCASASEVTDNPKIVTAAGLLQITYSNAVGESLNLAYYATDQVGGSNCSAVATGSPSAIIVMTKGTNATLTVARTAYQGGVAVAGETSRFVTVSNVTTLTKPGGDAESLSFTESGELYTVTRIAMNESSQSVSRVVEVFTNNPTVGRLLLTRSTYMSSQTVATVVSNEYYTDVGTDTAVYGQLRRTSSSDGSWTEWDFNDNGELLAVSGPWGDDPSMERRTAYAYVTNEWIGVVKSEAVETVGQGTNEWTVGRTEYGYSFVSNGSGEVEFSVVRRHAGDGSRLDETSGVFTTHSAFYYTFPDGKPAMSSSADGTLTTYAHSLGYWSGGEFVPSPAGSASLTVTTRGTSGEPDGLEWVSLITKDYTDDRGRPFRRDVFVKTDGADAKIGETGYEYDAAGRLTNRIENGQTAHQARHDDFGRVAWESGAEGDETEYQYDGAGRVRATVRPALAASGVYPAQGAVSNLMYYDGAGRVTQRVTVTSSGLSQTEAFSYDWAGRETSRRDALGLVTTTSYDSELVTTVTLPGGATQVTERNPDGSIKSITGTAGVHEYRSLSVEPTSNGMAFVQETITRGATNSTDVTVIVKDWLGRTVREERPNPAGGAAVAAVSAYNEKGQLTSMTSPGRATELYEYDGAGRQYRVGLDMDTNGLVLASSDQIQDTASCYTQGVGGIWERTATLTYPGDGQATTLALSETLRGPLSSTGGQSNETVSVDADGNETRTVTTVDRASKIRTVVSYLPGVSQPAVQVYRNGLLQSSASPEGRTVTYSHDDFGRTVAVADSAAGTTTTTYTNGQVATVADAFSNTTAFAYDSTTGLRTATTDALGKHTYFAHDAQGRQTRQWGQAAYPVSYSYDSYGRLLTMTTYRGTDDFSTATWPAGASGDTTTWNYDPATGLLTNKVYADGKGPAYSYNQAGLLAVRAWARSNGTVTTSYAYDGAGRLLGVDYSDATPDVTYAYFRHGGPSQITDASGTRTFTYSESLKQASEALDAAAGFADWVASNRYEATSGMIGRRTAFILADTNLTATVGYGYDVYNRLSQITSGAVRVGYRYQTAAPWVQTAEMFYSNAWRMAHVDQRDGGGRVTNAANHLLGAPAGRHGYGLDALGRRTTVGLADGSFWEYGYNDRSEVTLGQRKWDASTPVAGQRFEYAFDPIGNRLTSRRETNDPAATWAANSLNQYLSNTVPGVLHVMGQAHTGASVTVTGSLAGAATVTRRGEYFHGGLQEANGAAAVWETTVASASLTGAVSAATGHLFLAKSPQAFAYDEDGNLVADGRWDYAWDAENRLVGMTTRPEAFAAGVSSQRLAFAYDYMGRRVRKVVDAAVGTNWVNALTSTFAYDGWNLVRETRQTNGASPQVLSHVWGLDLSGSLQGAGGVGGLLATLPGTAVASPLLFGRDGNGNVTLAAAATNGAVVAEYEYGPFGEPLRVSGPEAPNNPFRWSTKYTDDETGLIYYGLRFLDPRLGRFLSKDPIDELGFNLTTTISVPKDELRLNPFLLCGNNAQGRVDPYGLTWAIGAWRFSIALSHPHSDSRVHRVALLVADILKNLDISMRISGIRIGANSYRPPWHIFTLDLLNGKSRDNVDDVLLWLTGPIKGGNVTLPGGQQVVHIFKGVPVAGFPSGVLGYTPGGLGWSATDRVAAFSDSTPADEELAIVIAHEMVTHVGLGLSHIFARGAAWDSRGITAAAPLSQPADMRKKIHCSLLPELQRRGAKPDGEFIISE